MNIIKSNVARMIVALMVVGVVSGVLLVFVYNYATPKIKVNVNTETDKAIRALFPGADKVSKNDAKGIYEVTGPKGNIQGYAFIAEGNGYQGEIRLLVGVDAAFSNMLGMEVLESQETPGLGAEIASNGFRSQFTGLVLTHPLVLVKNQKPREKYEVEAITGATISSRAVVNMINKKIASLKEQTGQAD